MRFGDNLIANDKQQEKAKELLKSSKLAIAEIAFQCGFNSQSHIKLFAIHHHLFIWQFDSEVRTDQDFFTISPKLEQFWLGSDRLPVPKAYPSHSLSASNPEHNIINSVR
jgi:AraC-like DNA-binding protein